MFRLWGGRATVLSRARQALTQTVDQVAVGLGEIPEEAVDCFDDDAPLRQTGDGAEGVEAGLELDGYPDAELRVVLDLLSFFGSCRRAAGATTIIQAVFRHVRRCWRRTAEMRPLQSTSNAYEDRRLTPAEMTCRTLGQGQIQLPLRLWTQRPTASTGRVLLLPAPSPGRSGAPAPGAGSRECPRQSQTLPAPRTGARDRGTRESCRSRTPDRRAAFPWPSSSASPAPGSPSASRRGSRCVSKS